MTLDNKLYTKAELEQLGFKVMHGASFASYDIYYKGDMRINRERYMFDIIKGNDGQEPRFKLKVEYKI